MTITRQHEIRDLIGAETYEALCRALAGTSLYIPKRLRAGSTLAALVGPKLAERLSAACGGQTLELPTARARHNRDLVMRLAGEGWTTGDIARASGLSLRRVRQIRAAFVADGEGNFTH
ncbi:helix-turn-helix domain-containing protein [Radicibacter daui]|uniref:helix-turn-helix domain-containing protein n=1 Tax=Radicibacter daui TaxID=3064829 RepID=UPI004046A222